MEITEYLEKHCTEIEPKDFYRLVFPEGELEAEGEYTDGKYNAIAVAVGEDTSQNKPKAKRYTVTDELGKIDLLTASDDFCIMSPISYAGKSRKSENARFLYAIAIDVDGIKTEQYKGEPLGMADLFYQFDGNGPANYLPKPTAIVSSGTGIHVYYIFKKAIPLFPNIVKKLEGLRTRLTWQLWTQGVTTLPDNVQYESLFQGFRVVGTVTKVGTRARAFLVDEGKKVDVEYLNKFVPEQYRAIGLSYKSELTLKEAKTKYPEWYQKRIVEKKPKGHWEASKDVYNWWIRKITEGAAEGHRYWCVMALATYAKKCGVDRETLEADALSLVPFLDNMTSKETNHFTSADVLDALEAYNDSYITYPIDTISYRTDIHIEKNKRNGQKQADHLEEARAIRDIRQRRKGTKWTDNNGRPTAWFKVAEFRRDNPEAKPKDCIKKTGLSKNTVYKWWKKAEPIELDI